ncbi:MAG TPA: hypothetical protein VJ761_02690 [Ktedonobacteraceae bacterium]|nr:hypothetical protein [Ktedonobacteraceae bacterium]
MANIEERLTALEHQHAALKEKIELQTIAIGALVNKATLERLNEKYDKLFDTLITHDRLTNEQLAELRAQQMELDGKLAGVQAETRQGFRDANARFEQQDGKLAGIQAETRLGFKDVNARFDQQDGKLAGVQAEMRQGFKDVNARFDQMTLLLNTLVKKPDQE